MKAEFVIRGKSPSGISLRMMASEEKNPKEFNTSANP